MSIKVAGLTKMYGNQKAVDNISFEINKGEIVAFLGPNGAGKSTTMKILTCFIPQTAGIAEVCGINTSKEPMAVKSKIGYLPEQNPLYYDMYVKEFLLFLADVHKLKNKKERVAEMIAAVGLTKEQNKRIGELSKGYKQRVGLAQAMLHDPEVLILDEPTTGLDPNQIVEIRNLIKSFGKDKTILLSTHIMQEVEAICDRIIIINQGKIVADDKTSLIQQNQTTTQVIRVEFDGAVEEIELSKISGVTKVSYIKDHIYLIECDAKGDIRKSIAQFAQLNNVLLLELHREEMKLEDVFKKLTA
jgi:ABC-2 type transport system ATP-binding protein